MLFSNNCCSVCSYISVYRYVSLFLLPLKAKFRGLSVLKNTGYHFLNCHQKSCKMSASWRYPWSNRTAPLPLVSHGLLDGACTTSSSSAGVSLVWSSWLPSPQPSGLLPKQSSDYLLLEGLDSIGAHMFLQATQARHKPIHHQEE